MDRLKNLLRHFLNVVVAMILMVGIMCYVGINTLMITQVINELRLDTYVTYQTGLGIVMLVLLLGWGPVWLMRALRDGGR